MPITDSDLVWRPAALVSDATPAQNGGRMALAAITSGVKNNLFPDASQSERTNGSVKLRKAFIHVNSGADIPLQSARVFLDALTPAGDFVVFHAGTQTDTQDQLTARPHGVGALTGPVAAGATMLSLAGEHPAEYETLQPFRVGDLVRVSDRPAGGGAGTGNEEWATVQAVNAHEGAITLTVTPQLANGYAAGALVSSALVLDNVAGGVTDVLATSAGGGFDATGGKAVAHNKGAIEETWTLTFTSATSFTVAGLATGTLPGTGTISADYHPSHAAASSYYFTLKATAWSGTWAAGDTVAFKTHPAAIPVWYRRVIPAGCSSLANDFCSLAIQGESA